MTFSKDSFNSTGIRNNAPLFFVQVHPAVTPIFLPSFLTENSANLPTRSTFAHCALLNIRNKAIFMLCQVSFILTLVLG